MAEAKMHKGRAIVAYVDGNAVDSDGQIIEGAPKQPKDTPRDKQPGAAGLDTPEARMGAAIATALRGGPIAVPPADANTSSGSDDADEDQGEQLPTLADMPAHLETITDVDEVKALQKQDDRKGAQDLYAARIAELGG